jgi:hypothetical protein
MKYYKLLVLSILALSGFIISLYYHVSAILGYTFPMFKSPWLLHFGMFALFAPAVVYSQRFDDGGSTCHIWKKLLSGAPKWMKLTTLILFMYAVLNFFYFIIVRSTMTPLETDKVVRGFSGHWLFFYFTSFTLLFSFSQIEKKTLRCSNGHEVCSSDSFCPVCKSFIDNNRK